MKPCDWVCLSKLVQTLQWITGQAVTTYGDIEKQSAFDFTDMSHMMT